MHPPTRLEGSAILLLPATVTDLTSRASAPDPAQQWWSACSAREAKKPNSLTETLNDLVQRNDTVRQSIALLDYPAYNGADGARKGSLFVSSLRRRCAVLCARAEGWVRERGD